MGHFIDQLSPLPGYIFGFLTLTIPSLCVSRHGVKFVEIIEGTEVPGLEHKV